MTIQRIWAIFAGLILLMPLAFGSYAPWVWSLAGIIIAALTLLLAWRSLKVDAEFAWRPALWVPLILFAGVTIWVLIQYSGIGPAHPIWALAADALGEKALPGAMSIAPQATLVSLIRLLSFAGAFWIGLQGGRDRDRAFQFLRWFSYASGVYALYGLITFVAGNEYLLWRVREAYLTDVTGTFVNRNSYATFAGIGLITSTALLIQEVRRGWRLVDPTLPLVARILSLLRGEVAIQATILPIVTMALLQSHSRMGVFSTAIGMVALLLVGRVIRTARGRMIGGGVALLVEITLFAVSGNMLAERIDKTTENDRLPIFALTVKAIETAPLGGHGYGSFANVFPMFRDMTLPNSSVYGFAHDTYLELALEIGLPAAAALVFAILWLTALCLIGAYRRNRDEIVPSIAFAVAVLIGTHALLDFSVQMPAIGCLFGAILGIGNAQAWSLLVRKARGTSE